MALLRCERQLWRNYSSYDVEVNSEGPLDGNVALLIRAWKERKRPSALDKMMEEMRV